MKKKLPHRNSARPEPAAAKTEAVFGTPDNRFDLLNKYGTYNIQPTADADNLFPMIAPGLPTACSKMKLEKETVEHLNS